MQAEDTAADSAHLRSTCGRVIPLHVPRWFDEPGPDEQAVLDQAVPATLDIGCGPGRHTLALAGRGVYAVGIDTAPEAVRAARARGAHVLHRSVFDRLPDEGSWGSALLLDGNVGIGGDPFALLTRVGAILRPGGRLMIELDGPGRPNQELRVQPRAGTQGWLPWSTDARFPWATVSVDGLEQLATRTGFTIGRVWSANARWFARVDAP